MCIYGMDSPGGYQLIGRTIPIWNNDKKQPWFLRWFDRICFYQVTQDEITKLRHDFKTGDFKLIVEEGEFDLKKFTAEKIKNKLLIDKFVSQQRDIDISWNGEKLNLAPPTIIPEVGENCIFAPCSV